MLVIVIVRPKVSGPSGRNKFKNGGGVGGGGCSRGGGSGASSLGSSFSSRLSISNNNNNSDGGDADFFMPGWVYLQLLRCCRVVI